MITIIKNSMRAYNYEITIFRMIYCFFSNDFLIFPRFQTIEANFTGFILREFFLFVKNNFTKTQ